MNHNRDNKLNNYKAHFLNFAKKIEGISEIFMDKIQHYTLTGVELLNPHMTSDNY